MCSACRRPRQGPHCSLQYLKEDWREDILFAETQQENETQWTQIAAREISIGLKKNMFPSRGGSALAQVPKRGWGICILGDVQKSPGQGPEQPDLAWDLTLL